MVVAKLSGCRQLVLAPVLFCIINVLNYMNRHGTAQIVGRLKAAFQVDDSSLGLIPTGFEICFVVCSPFLGYFGDRFNRCYLIAGSLLLSSISGMASSFVPESAFFLLILMRSLLGTTEAASIILCTSMIGDLFVGKMRSLVLAVFLFALPIGGGLGFICSGLVADFADDWRWAFRLTPFPMFLSAICLVTLLREPERGEAEKVVGLYETTSFKEDLKYLIRIPSYIFSTFAIAGVAFSSNALLYWIPELIQRMHAIRNSPLTESSLAVVLFGLIASLGGVIGVVLGASISSFLLKPRLGPAADGLVSGFGMIIGAPLCFFMLLLMTENIAISWCLLLLTVITTSASFSLSSEITLNVVMVTRRSTARSIDSTVAHLIGDAASSYLAGKISDNIRWLKFDDSEAASSYNNFLVINFTSLQWSLLFYTLVIALSGGLYLLASLFINKDAASVSDYKSLEKTKTSDELTVDDL